jgi:hypothetical protein
MEALERVQLSSLLLKALFDKLTLETKISIREIHARLNTEEILPGRIIVKAEPPISFVACPISVIAKDGHVVISTLGPGEVLTVQRWYAFDERRKMLLPQLKLILESTESETKARDYRFLTAHPSLDQGQLGQEEATHQQVEHWYQAVSAALMAKEGQLDVSGLKLTLAPADLNQPAHGERKLMLREEWRAQRENIFKRVWHPK